MTYDYECGKCKSSYTVERGIRDAEVLPVCVDCHESMTRVWSSPGVTFKGTGFYSTDYKH
jgi:putative FmdB family regulatory protein